MVAVEARNAGGRPDPGPVPLALVLPRGTRRRDGDCQQVTVLPTDPRSLPSVAPYDQLLTLDATATS